MTELTWSYGITTVPKRQNSLLQRTVKSLGEAGFDHPHLFVDGCVDSSLFQGMNFALGAVGDESPRRQVCSVSG
jgi:hypothetical protein